GAAGEGWAFAMTVLSNERHRPNEPAPAGHDTVENLIRAAKAAGRLDDAAVQAKLAQWWVEEQGVRNFDLRVKAALNKGDPPPAAVAMIKLVSATMMQHTNAFLMDLGGYGGLFSAPDRPQQDQVFSQYIWSAAMRIAGGADEILRNQLAE